MALAPSRHFGFVKLPGKSKRWRNESNPDFPVGATISDRAMSGLTRSLRFAGQAISKERYAKGVKKWSVRLPFQDDPGVWSSWNSGARDRPVRA